MIMSNFNLQDKPTAKVRDSLFIGISIATFYLFLLPFILGFTYPNQLEISLAIGLTFLVSLTSFVLSKYYPKKTFDIAKYEFLFYTVSIGFVLHYIDFLNGHLIFIYGLVILAAAYFLETKNLTYISGLAALFVIAEYFILIETGNETLSGESSAFMLLRVLYLILLAQVGKNLGLDLSAQRRQYRKLNKLNKQLNELDNLKGEFIDIASHQLKTPLTVVRGNVSMVIEGDYGKVTENILMPLKEVEIGAKKLSDIINSVVDTFKFEKDMPLILERKIADLEKLIRSEMETFLPDSWAKNTRVYLHADKNIPKTLLDPEKIKLVLSIYLDNAMKHSLKNSRIEIFLKRLDKSINVEVSDLGPQIADKKTDKIFYRYAKVKKENKEYLERTGLNLYVAKRIVESHNGKVYYQPREDGGNVFGFELPIEHITKRNKKRITSH